MYDNDAQLLETLRWDGIALLPQLLTDAKVVEVQDYFAYKQVYAAHVDSRAPWMDRTPRSLEETQNTGSAHACYSMRDCIRAPSMLRHALGHLDLAADYLRQEPLLYSINTWNSFTTGPIKLDTQAWHRDKDDVRFVGLFTFLTDQYDEGEHHFILGSHRTLTETPPDHGRDWAIEGAAGTAFMADTSGFHYGAKPLTHTRMISWARFCVSEKPASYGWDKIEPISAPEILAGLSDRERHAVRLIIKG